MIFWKKTKKFAHILYALTNILVVKFYFYIFIPSDMIFPPFSLLTFTLSAQSGFSLCPFLVLPLWLSLLKQIW